MVLVRFLEETLFLLLLCSQQLRDQLAKPVPLLDIRVIFNSTRRDEHLRTDNWALCTLLDYSYSNIHFQGVLGKVLLLVKGNHVPTASPNYLYVRQPPIPAAAHSTSVQNGKTGPWTSL